MSHSHNAYDKERGVDAVEQLSHDGCHVFFLPFVCGTAEKNNRFVFMCMDLNIFTQNLSKF